MGGWYIGQQQTFGIVPIKCQITYWAISTLAVTNHQIYLGGLNTSCACWTSVLVGLIVLSLPCLLFHDIRVRLYWCGLFGLATAAGNIVSPCMDVLSKTLLNYQKSMAVHFCLSFVVISEAEWWRYLRGIVLHPVIRDIHSAYYPFREQGLRNFHKWMGRYVLAWPIGKALVVAVMTATGRGGWAIRFTWQSTTLFSAGISGQAVQAFTLLRPLRHLTAWLADGIASLISELWSRLWLRIRGEKKIDCTGITVELQ
jgi:hypothetical protein